MPTPNPPPGRLEGFGSLCPFQHLGVILDARGEHFQNLDGVVGEEVMHRVRSRACIANVVAVFNGAVPRKAFRGEEPQHPAVQLEELPARGLLERLLICGERAGNSRFARQVVRRRGQDDGTRVARKDGVRLRHDDGRRRGELAFRRLGVAFRGERELGGHGHAFALEERARELVARQHVVLALVDDGNLADVEVGGGHGAASVWLEDAHPV
jgi:hypothetical protein